MVLLPPLLPPPPLLLLLTGDADDVWLTGVGCGVLVVATLPREEKNVVARFSRELALDDGAEDAKAALPGEDNRVMDACCCCRRCLASAVKS